MTPEERREIAARDNHDWEWCKHTYPDCCPYHEGFDAALEVRETT